VQPLYIELAEDPATPPQPIHLGFRLGVRALRTYLGVGVQSVQKVPVTWRNKISWLCHRQQAFSCKNKEFLPIPMPVDGKRARNRRLPSLH
jgi:hypothetical protein